ncbi:hypothetical protein D3C81_1089750 [compost metagenome]
MAILFLDVFAHRAAQPFQARRQARAARHHQRHGMAHMVVCLGQEGHIAVEADVPRQRIAYDRHGEQGLTLLGGLQLQRVKKGHGRPHNGISDNWEW